MGLVAAVEGAGTPVWGEGSSANRTAGLAFADSVGWKWDRQGRF